MYHSYYHSPIGTIKIEANEKALTRIKLLYHSEDLQEQPNLFTLEAKKQLEEYFLGKRKKFDLKYELQGTAFQCLVWKELAKLKYGELVSYKEIAKRIGKEKAVRAVANAIGKNSFLIIVPCHRVIGSNGTLTGFSAQTEQKDGLTIKKELLILEKSLYEY